MNLLHIHSDQHCYKVTGCYGDPIVKTPCLDMLAQEGAVFDAAYCPSPICVPSRMSMLTARHPVSNEVWTNQHALHSAMPTFAHSLGAAGYRPVLAGRMHSVGPDQLHGYANRLVGDHGPNYLGGVNPSRGALKDTAGPWRVSVDHSGSGQSGYEVHDEAVTDAAVSYLEECSPDQPFALSVGYMLPHPPYVARKKDFERYRDTVQMPANQRSFPEEGHPFLSWWRESGQIDTPVPDDKVLDARAAYWALVDRMDAMIARLVAALDARGLRETTVIVYTSDHGDMLGEHGLWWKHVFYEESARIPMIISWPDGLLPYRKGRRISNPVSAIDLTATMLDILDAPPLPDSDGRSLVPLLAEASGVPDEPVYSEYCSDEGFAPAEGTFQRMIRRGPWKYIYIHGYPDQLFNLAEDPEELSNRAEDPECGAVIDELRAALFDGWDPEGIRGTMKRMRMRDKLLTQWGQRVQPADRFRWPMKPEMNYLD